MSVLSKIRERLTRRSDWSDPAVSVRADGFDVGGTSIAWNDVQEISAHKIDLLTTDEVRFAFVLDSGRTLTVSEEQRGFEELIGSLEALFGSVAGWESKVIHPAFEASHSVLYRRT